MTTVTARLIEQRGRLRLLAHDGLFVQCPREWRATLVPGVAVTLDARKRADGRCWVFCPPCWSL